MVRLGRVATLYREARHRFEQALDCAQACAVCHGPGIEFLLKKKPHYLNRLQMDLKNVSYAGCEFTMSQRNIKKEDLVEFAKTVPYGIAEIIKKQQLDWLYIKLGF